MMITRGMSSPHTRSRASIGVALVTVVTLAAAGLGVGTPSAGARASGARLQQPVFENGMAMPVFTEDPADYIVQELWVTAPTDSDRDGRPDVIHIDVTRPRETARGLRVPVVLEASPYYAGGNDVANHNVDRRLYAPMHPGDRSATDDSPTGPATSHHGPGVISDSLISDWVPRGFAVVHAESEGTGGSTGCATSGGRNETLGIKAVVDWLRGRAVARDRSGARVAASWTTGHVGMIGTSYNGTLPNAVAATGVEGLDAIVPVSAISSWYDYYRANGAVIAPGGYQGEDLDILARYVNTRVHPWVCRPVIRDVHDAIDRRTGDYGPQWDERNYVKNADRVHAAVLVAHGLSDWNVKTTQAAQWYEAIEAAGVPHLIYWHQGGHGGEPPFGVQVRWFTRFLYGQHNGIEHGDHALIERENGNLRWYANWPDPATRSVPMSLTPHASAPTGGLQVGRSRRTGASTVETFSDIPTQTAASLAGAPDPDHGLVYATTPLTAATRISGTPTARLRLSFGQYAANVSVALADLAPDGSVTRLVTEGWRDPQNRDSLSRTEIVRPYTTYRLDVPMQATDYVFGRGHRIAFVLLQTDHDFTIRPPAGNTLSLRTAATSVVLPVVGGATRLPTAQR